MLTCMASIVLVAYIRPYPTRSENDWEIINETQVTITLYFLFGVTDIITEPEIKDQIGWAMITCTSTTLSICLLRAGCRSFVEFYRLMRVKMLKRIKKTRVKDKKARGPPKKTFSSARIWEDYLSSQYSSDVADEFSIMQAMSGEEMVETRIERL